MGLTKRDMCISRYFKVLILLLLVSGLVSGCRVRDYLEPHEKAAFKVRLHYVTDMAEREINTDNLKKVSTKGAFSADKIHYTVCLYPQTVSGSVWAPLDKVVLTRDVAEGFDIALELKALPGNYVVMVWSDVADNDCKSAAYNINDFLNISKSEDVGDNDECGGYAFAGKCNITVEEDMQGEVGQIGVIKMERPYATLSVVSTDLQDFIDSEVRKHKLFNIENYKAVLYFAGFYPNVYSIFANEPVNSITGFSLNNKLTEQTGGLVSLGYDNIFCSSTGSFVTVRVEVFDREGNRLTMSNLERVPLSRGVHTIVKGKFLTQTSSGGINIDVDFDGDHNIIIKP